VHCEVAALDIEMRCIVSRDSTDVITVAALLAWVYFAFPVLHYGSAWQSQHDPRRNVTVTFAGGGSISGDLSSRFDGLRELRHGDKVTIFSMESVREISYPWDPAIAAERVNSVTIASHWRLFSAYLAYLLPPLIAAFWLVFRATLNKSTEEL